MSNVVAEFEVHPAEPVVIEFTLYSYNNEHNLLRNRDMADQHPMGAITGLITALNGKQDVIYDLDEIRNGAGLGATAVQNIETGSANGTISVDGNNVPVRGLGSAAYTSSSDYDVVGSANMAETNAKNYADSLAVNYATAEQGAKAETAVQPSDLHNSTITITQGGTIKGSFNLNQSTDETIELDEGGGGGSAVWGDITGDINDQTDLKNALNAKQDVISDLATIRSGAGLGATALQPSALNGYATQTWVGQQGYITGITSSDVTTALGYTPYNSSNPNDYQTATQVANSISTETTNRENADISLQNQIDAIVASSDVFDIVGTYAELQAYDISTVPVNDIIKVLVDSTHSNAATYYRCVETGDVKSWSYIGSEGAYYTKGEADSTFVPQTRTVNSKALSQNITLTASDVGADASGSASTAETNAKNYADSLASNYATSAQGALADTAVQPADIANMQTTANLVTSVSSASTDSQYPSAKLFYDTCGDIETLINAL